MADIIPLHRCGRCGAQGQPIEIVQVDDADRVIAQSPAVVCDACMARVEGDLDRARPVFETMIACGVPSDIADNVMAYLMMQWPDP